MKGNKIVSMLAFPDSNVYRVQITRFTNKGIKVNTYICSYKSLRKVTRLSTLAHRMNPLISHDLIRQRRLEHGYPIGEK